MNGNDLGKGKRNSTCEVGKYPAGLFGLINDLLERSGEHLIASIEYVPSEQVPLLPGLKLSILDVRCREVGGAVFVVEMQVLPVTGFLNRVVYDSWKSPTGDNACKAYVGTLLRGKAFETLTDVMAVSICDFELWPDKERDAQGQARVPLGSHWRMAERVSGAAGSRAPGRRRARHERRPALGLARRSRRPLIAGFTG